MSSRAPSFDRRALPLLLAAPDFLDPGETQPLDRIRMQKGVFLLEKRGPSDWGTCYEYVPYNWGPYAPSLSSDVNSLVSDGAMTLIQFDGFHYGEYRTTAFGMKSIQELMDELDQQVLDFIRDVRRYVTTASFNRLLRDVYDAYPEYATRTRFRT